MSGVLGGPKVGLVGGELDHCGRYDGAEGLAGVREVDGRGKARLSSRPRLDHCFDSWRPLSIFSRDQPENSLAAESVTVT